MAQIILWPGNFAPMGWALCNGDLLSISQNAALYALLGTTYGGNGQTTFGLPNLIGKVVVGAANVTSPGVLSGSSTGTASAIGVGAVTLTTANIPAHTHTATFTPGGSSSTVQISIPVNNTASAGTGTSPSGKVLGVIGDSQGASAPVIYAAASDGSTLAPFSVSVPAGGGSVSNANTGSGTAIPLSVTMPVSVPIMQPSLSLNYIIAVQGIFPSRN